VVKLADDFVQLDAFAELGALDEPSRPVLKQGVGVVDVGGL